MEEEWRRHNLQGEEEAPRSARYRTLSTPYDLAGRHLATIAQITGALGPGLWQDARRA